MLIGGVFLINQAASLERITSICKICVLQISGQLQILRTSARG
jgi:hypothetical protein